MFENSGLIVNIFIIKWKVYEIMNMLLAWFNDFMTYIGQNYIPYAQFYLLKKIGNKNNNILNMKSLWTKLTKKEKRKNRKLRVVTIWKSQKFEQLGHQCTHGALQLRQKPSGHLLTWGLLVHYCIHRFLIVLHPAKSPV